MPRLTHRPLRRFTRLRPVALKPKRGRIEDPAYRAWIRTLDCLIQSRECRGATDPHHVGRYGQSRNNDYTCVPLCRRHHDLAHELKRGFEARFGVSFAAAIQGLNDEWELSHRRIA